MKILVITSVFPNEKQPTHGIFVKERTSRVAQHCEIKVIAPVPWFPFARCLLKKGYRPKVPYLEIQDGIEVYHPRFFNIPKFFKFLDGLFFFISSIVTAWKLNKHFKFDIIDSHFVYPDGFGAVLLGRLLKTPVTITVRGTIKKLLKYPLIKAQIKYALRKSVKVFTVCNDLKKTVTTLKIPEEKVIVVPNGVDIEQFRQVEKGRVRKELGLPGDRKIMVSVGGLVERKGFHRIISALPGIKKVIPNVMYLIVGGSSLEGNYEPVLRKTIEKLDLKNDVFFAGIQPHNNLYKWLNASDIFCLATSNEGWANVFLEAMACGLPVVTSRVGGNEEVVSAKDYGLLFKLEDKQEMVESIIKAFLTDWKKERIVNYAQLNTWDKTVNKLISQFEQITGCNSTVSPTREVVL